MSEIQWYPGHMTRAKRNIEKDLKLADLVIELLDARAPASTENPDIGRLTKGKKRLILLNKADLADPAATAAWAEALTSQDTRVLALDSRSRDSLAALRRSISQLAAEKQERDRQRGIPGTRAVRALVAGIPNVGKSTLINTLAGKVSAVTGNRPGVTRGNQWISAGKDLLLLDTPGVLWPKFEDRRTGYHLAMLGAINDDILDQADVSVRLTALLLENYRELFLQRYRITEEELQKQAELSEESIPGLNRPALAALELSALKRGCVKKGGLPDYDRAARLLIEDFRSGKTGRITLERP